MMTQFLEIEGQFCLEMDDGGQNLCYVSFGTDMKECITFVFSLVEATLLVAQTPSVIKAAFERSLNYASEHNLHTRGNHVERSLGFIKSSGARRENNESSSVDGLSDDIPTTLSVV